MKKTALIAIGLILFLGIINSWTKKPPLKNIPSPLPSLIVTEQSPEDLTITKERFNFFNDSYIKLAKLQGEYEQTYKQYGVLDSDKISDDFGDSLIHAKRYGSIINDVSVINNSIPKYASDMASGEKELSFKLKDYATALIFLTPKPEGIDGIDYVQETREALEKSLSQVKSFNHL